MDTTPRQQGRIATQALPVVAVTLSHTFETAHRLPHLRGKCESLHGHSWRADVTVEAPRLSSEETVVEFGTFKAGMRGWIDSTLDHATMLGAADPLIRPLEDNGCRVFVFGRDWAGPHQWPTVEAVTALIADQAQRHWLRYAEGFATAPQARVSYVHVVETDHNAAEWLAP